METFAGISPVTGEFASQSPVTRRFDVFFDLCLKKGWVNNRETDDLRHHHAHYDVNVMTGTFARQNMPTEKLTNRALITPVLVCPNRGPFEALLVYLNRFQSSSGTW